MTAYQAFVAEHGKRTLRAAILMLTVAVFVYLGRLVTDKLMDPDILPYRTVTVEGSFKHVDADTVRAIVAPYLGAGFFGVDVGDVRQALRTIPWVDSATVRRVWPDEIHVTLFEQTAIAHWGDKALLNSADEVFVPDDPAGIEGLPYVYGPEGTAMTVMATYRIMTRMLAPYDLHIRRLNLDERRAWHLSLDDQLELVLGRENAVERLQRFIRFYPEVLAGKAREIKAVDLRYTNGFVVRWNIPSEKVFNSEMG